MAQLAIVLERGGEVSVTFLLKQIARAGKQVALTKARAELRAALRAAEGKKVTPATQKH